jgi:hypothetical protein
MKKVVAKKPIAKKPKPAAKKLAAKKPAAKKPAAKKPAAKKKRAAAAVRSREVPLPTPSERALATCAEIPTERDLTEEERAAMQKVSETARQVVGADGTPVEIVVGIASFLEDVRLGKREEPKSHDVRLGLGVLWGDQLLAQVGWRWVHLTYPDGFASYAVVPDDRAFACFPLNRVPDALRSAGTNTSAHVFDSIREGSLPARKPRAYLVIG